MNRTSLTCTTALAIGLTVTGLTGGLGLASADPGPPPCVFPGCTGPGNPGGPGGLPPDDHRGPDGPPPGDHRGPDGPSPWDHNPGWGPPPPDQAWRGIEQGRFDHQPFNYNGLWVNPVFQPDFNQWGFWFFGIWIPL